MATSLQQQKADVPFWVLTFPHAASKASAIFLTFPVIIFALFESHIQAVGKF